MFAHTLFEVTERELLLTMRRVLPLLSTTLLRRALTVQHSLISSKIVIDCWLALCVVFVCTDAVLSGVWSLTFDGGHLGHRR